MGYETAPRELRLDQLVRDYRKLGLPDAIGAPAVAKLAGDLGPSTTSVHRLSDYPRDEDWFTTPWGTRATEKGWPSPSNVMGLNRALGIPTRSIVLAAATSAGIPDVWRDHTEVARARLWDGWDELPEDRWSALRDVGQRMTDDHRQERRITELQEEVTRLQSEVRKLTRAANRRKP